MILRPARATAPGKLMIAGEYAILEPHHTGLVAAVDRHVQVTITPEATCCLELPDWEMSCGFELEGARPRFDAPDPRLRLAGAAIEVALSSLLGRGLAVAPFRLRVDSRLEGTEGRKYGLGSSAACAAALVGAILTALGDEEALDRDRVFKLAAIAHLMAQGGGSGADVAASVYGGVLLYASFQPGWLGERLSEPIPRLERQGWPFLAITPSAWPAGWRLLAGWTGVSVSTPDMLMRILAFRDRSPAAYSRFLSESRGALEALSPALAAGDYEKARLAIERNRRALATLGAAAVVPIETPALARLAAIAGALGHAAKGSGAGGGDCGIALLPEQADEPRLAEAWQAAGIEPLSVGLDGQGLRLEAL